MPEDGGEGKESGEKPAVFISYASQDAAIANAVVEALERGGVGCWIAPRDVTLGAFYADEIIHAIDVAKASVLILSKNAAASQHVLREVERAYSKRHPVISLRIDQSALPAGLEYFLNTSQWLDASGGEVSRSIPRLIAAVRVAIQTPAVTPEVALTPRSPALSLSARSWNRTAIVMASLSVLAVTGFAIDRLWSSSRRTAPISAPTAAVAIPAPAPAASAISERSIAVLPFLDMSEKKDQEYFSDGMSEELIDMLTRIPDLRVPARTSSFYFKDKPTTIPDIAKALNVFYVLEGSVRKAGGAIRVTAQLIRADNGYHIWSETYDRKLDDVFKVQDEIGAAVVEKLKLSLASASFGSYVGTQNVEAYNRYLQARSIYEHYSGEPELRIAIAYLRQALDADPTYANAWALLSNSLSTLVEEGYESADKMGDEPRRAAERAITVGPQVADGYVALARILIVSQWDLTGAGALIRQALRLDDRNQWALSWAATLAAMKGEFDKSLEFVHRSIVSDPVNPYRTLDLAEISYYAGKYSDAVAAQRRVRDLNPGDPWNQCAIGRDLQALGNSGGALEEIERVSDTDMRETCLWRVIADDALGRKADADAALAKLSKQHAKDGPCDIARVYASRGQLDQAFSWLDQARRVRDYQLLWIRVDPIFAQVRSDPRFSVLLRKMNLPD